MKKFYNLGARTNPDVYLKHNASIVLSYDTAIQSFFMFINLLKSDVPSTLKTRLFQLP